MTNSKYAAFVALDPFFDIVMQGLAGAVDGDHYFEAIANDAVFEYRYVFPGFPTKVEGRDALMALYSGYGDSTVLHSGDALVVHRSMLAFSLVSLASFLARDVRAGLGLHHLGTAVGNSLFWFLWFEVLAILGTLTTRSQGPQGERAAREALPIRTRFMALVGLLVLASVGSESDSVLLWGAWFVGLGLLLAMEARSGVLRAHALLDHPPTGSAPLDRVRMVIAVVTLAFFALLFMPSPFPL